MTPIAWLAVAAALIGIIVLCGLFFFDLCDAFVCPTIDEDAAADEDSDFPGPTVTARNGTPTV
jgi:hypothetical protein